MAEVAARYTPQRVQAITGVAPGDLYQMARLYAGHPPGSLIYAMGITQHTCGVDNVKACCNLAMLCGYVEINPEDAARHHINAGDTVILASRRGEMEAPVRITDAVTPGTLFLPIHFGENPTNILTSSDALDPLAKIPEFKVSAVQLRKLEA